MKAFDYIPLYTYKDYKLWEGEWELIHGYPHAMSPSPVRAHQKIVKKVQGKFDELLEAKIECKECEVYSDLDWIVNDSTVVRPDVMVVCGEFKTDFLTFPPVLVVEVLSKATSMKDRNIKYNLYQAQQVKYYILINPDSQTCEIFELKNGLYEANDNCRIFTLDTTCTLELNISELIASLHLN